jgi:hypothetical protein
MIYVALELTDEQFLLLRGLAARATAEEEKRRDRMHARPRGAHTPARLAEVAENARDFAEIERQVETHS